MSSQQTVSARKAAQLLDVSDTTVRNWIADGVIEATRPKPRQPWRIALSDIERLRNCEAGAVSANQGQSAADTRDGEPVVAAAKFEVGSAKIEERSANANTEVRTANLATSEHGPGDRADEAEHSEREALLQELEILQVKLEASEERNEATRREQETLRGTLDRSDQDINHLRGLTSQQADTIQNLTEEMKGLTIALHHEQNQRLALETHIKDEEEEQEEKKRGFLRRAFTRKPKRKRGKFARVGPS